MCVCVMFVCGVMCMHGWEGYSARSEGNVSSSEFSREFSVSSEYSRDVMERGSSESAGTASSLPLQIIVNSSS